jgi:hypothetical protein
MSEPMRLRARVEIDYEGKVMGVLVYDGEAADLYDSSLRLFVGRDGIEIEDLRDRLKGDDDE